MVYVIFVAICVMWGTNFVLIKKATLWFEPASVGALRIAGGAVLLAAVQFWFGKPWPLRRKDFGPLLLVALLGYAFPFILQPILIERCGSGFIGMMVCFVPLMTIVVSIPMLGIYPTPRLLLGVGGGLLFLMPILRDGIDRQITVVDFALAACVPLIYSICNTYIKRRFVGVAPLPLALSCLCLALVLTVPPAAVHPVTEGATAADRSLAVFAVLVLGVLGTGCGALGFTKLLQDRGPLFAGMVTYLVPTIALVWGWIDNETVTVQQVTSLVGVLAMVAIVQFGSRGVPKPKAPADA